MMSRRVLGLRRHPVVLHRLEDLSQEGIDLVGVAPEYLDPFHSFEIVGQLLRLFEVPEIHEGVVDFHVLDPVVGQLPL
jgi:hypothetical protein